MAGAHDEQVGLVTENLVDDQGFAIGRVRDAAAVDNPPATTRLGRAEAELEPGGERGLDRERPPLHGRAPQAEDAELVRGFDGGEAVALEELGVCPRDSYRVPSRLSSNRGRVELKPTNGSSMALGLPMSNTRMTASLAASGARPSAMASSRNNSPRQDPRGRATHSFIGFPPSATPPCRTSAGASGLSLQPSVRSRNGPVVIL